MKGWDRGRKSDGVTKIFSCHPHLGLENNKQNFIFNLSRDWKPMEMFLDVGGDMEITILCICGFDFWNNGVAYDLNQCCSTHGPLGECGHLADFKCNLCKNIICSFISNDKPHRHKRHELNEVKIKSLTHLHSYAFETWLIIISEYEHKIQLLGFIKLVLSFNSYGKFINEQYS